MYKPILIQLKEAEKNAQGCVLLFLFFAIQIHTAIENTHLYAWKQAKKLASEFIHLNEKCFCFPLKYCFFFVGPRHFVQRKYNKVFRVLNEPKLLETTGTKLISYRIYLREMRISRFVVITVGRYNLSWRTE